MRHTKGPSSPCTRLKTLALDLQRERTEGRKREKFYIYLDVTHTHRHCLWQGGVHADEVKVRMERGMKMR